MCTSHPEPSLWLVLGAALFSETTKAHGRLNTTAHKQSEQLWLSRKGPRKDISTLTPYLEVPNYLSMPGGIIWAVCLPGH